AFTLGTGLLASCDSTVSGTGGNGHGGSTTSGCEGEPCCLPGQSGCCVPCDTTSTTTSTSTSTTTGAGGKSCGPNLPATRPADEFCDSADDQCGANDANGVCTKRPLGCEDIYMPTCGCDHMVYGNDCAANGSGQDSNVLGGCTAPAGSFGCGAHFCDLA